METLYVRKFSDELHKKARLRAVEENHTPRELVIKAAEVYLKAGKNGGK